MGAGPLPGASQAEGRGRPKRWQVPVDPLLRWGPGWLEAGTPATQGSAGQGGGRSGLGGRPVLLLLDMLSQRWASKGGHRRKVGMGPISLRKSRLRTGLESHGKAGPQSPSAPAPQRGTRTKAGGFLGSQKEKVPRAWARPAQAPSGPKGAGGCWPLSYPCKAPPCCSGVLEAGKSSGVPWKCAAEDPQGILLRKPPNTRSSQAPWAQRGMRPRPGAPHPQRAHCPPHCGQPCSPG